MTADSPWSPTSIPPVTERRPGCLHSPFVVIPVITALHATVFLMSLLITWESSMNAFETGRAPSRSAVIAGWINSVLQFPLVPLVPRSVAAGHWSWLVVVANSLLWAAVTWYCISGMRRRGRGMGAAPAD